ncbi:Hydroxyneurosporene synthase [Aspergillus spinulosporus]
MFSKIDIALWAALAAHQLPFCSGYNFAPDQDPSITDPRMPVLFDVPVPQKLLPSPGNPVSGHWTSSFLTTTTGSQYYFASGVVLSSPEQTAGYGFSLLDLATLNRITHSNMTTLAGAEIVPLNFVSTGYAISSRPSQPAITVHGTAYNVSVDLTVHQTSRALYYGGSGAWMYVDRPLYGWAMPAASTSGNISMPIPPSAAPAEEDDVDVEIATEIVDPSASLTWYNHLWGHLGLQAGNLTWFSLFVNDRTGGEAGPGQGELNLALVSYMLDSIDPPFSSRSIHIQSRNRDESGLAIIPVDWFEPITDPETVWTSPRSGLVYPQRWELGIEGRGLLEISSVLGDQEMVDPGSGAATYLGFVTVQGVIDGKEVTGYGSAEVKFVQRLP